MAERRMFAKTIIDSDAFLDMPLSAQALYFHLSMRADDDGFINNPKKIQRMVGASDDDCKLLLMKRFVIGFESGVIVIKHWKIHNYIQKDRYKPTIYQEEKALLDEKDNKAYTECIQDGYRVDTQDRIGKVSLGKDRIGKVSLGKDSLVEGNNTPSPAPQEGKKPFGEHENVRLTDSELAKLIEEYGETEAQEAIEFLDEYIASNPKYKKKSHYLALRRWVFDAIKEKRIKAMELEQRERRAYDIRQKQQHEDLKKIYGSSFDTDDFFNASLKRTFGEDFEL